MRSRARARGAAFLFAAAAAFLCACDDPGRMAGGASETEATVAGRVQRPDGSPVAGALVRLRPTYFLPDTGTAGAARAPADTVTDADGTFRFPSVFLGDYALEAGDGSRGALGLASVDGSRGRLDAGALVLRPTASVRGRIALPPGSQGAAYVRVYGLDRRVKADSAGRFALDGLPAGVFDLRVTPTSPLLSPRSVFGVALPPGAAVDLGDIPLAPAPDAEDLSAWGDSARIRVDTRAAGTNGNVAAFPLLVRLERPAFDFSSSTGLDLRVADARGRRLPYEIERWDPLSGKAELWVRCDSLRLGDSAQFLTLYWNRPGAPGRSDGTAVFDTADGYQGAWHLARAAGGPAVFRDASGQGNDAYGDGLDSAAPAAGVSYLGQDLDGASQALHTAKAFPGPDTFTVSLWFKTATTQGGKLIGFGSRQTGPSPNNDRQAWMDAQGRIHFGVYPALPPGQPKLGENKVLVSPRAYNDGQWHYLAARLSDAGQALFLDGEPVAVDPASRRAFPYSGFWRIGYDAFGTWDGLPRSPWFQGAVDEVRVARAAWSDAFIRLAYANQKPGSPVASLRR